MLLCGVFERGGEKKAMIETSPLLTRKVEPHQRHTHEMRRRRVLFHCLSHCLSQLLSQYLSQTIVPPAAVAPSPFLTVHPTLLSPPHLSKSSRNEVSTSQALPLFPPPPPPPPPPPFFPPIPSIQQQPFPAPRLKSKRDQSIQIIRYTASVFSQCKNSHHQTQLLQTSNPRRRRSYLPARKLLKKSPQTHDVLNAEDIDRTWKGGRGNKDRCQNIEKGELGSCNGRCRREGAY